MKISTDLDNMVVVELSRKNVEGLLSQLDDGARDAQVIRRDEGGKLLTVIARENTEHYGGRRSGWSGPGQTFGEQH